MKNKKTPPAPNYYIDLDDKAVHVDKSHWAILDRDGDSRLFSIGPNESVWLYEDDMGEFFEVVVDSVTEEEQLM